jgi:hypothetical protein
MLSVLSDIDNLLEKLTKPRDVEKEDTTMLPDLEAEDTTTPPDLEKEKAKRAFHAQLVWLKDFLDEGPSMMKVGELELRHCIGRIKKAYQAWSSGRILHVAHMWCTAMSDKPNSSFKKLTWLEKLASNKRRKPQRGIETEERFRALTSNFEKLEEAALQLRVQKGRQKAKKPQSFIKQFLQASAE